MMKTYIALFFGVAIKVTTGLETVVDRSIIDLHLQITNGDVSLAQMNTEFALNLGFTDTDMVNSDTMTEPAVDLIYSDTSEHKDYVVIDSPIGNLENETQVEKIEHLNSELKKDLPIMNKSVREMHHII
jgi:hypothetical protein